MPCKRLALVIGSTFFLVLAGCGRSDSAVTPPGVAAATTIDFAKVANYSRPALPAYFDGSVEKLDARARSNPISDRAATLGRVLFYDLQLSTNNRASCASCHRQRLGFTDSMQFSNGISGAVTTDFHAMRLGNLRYWQPGTMFWDRRAGNVEQQTSQPLHSLVELGWGGPAGGMEALTAKMAQTDYYPDLFAWAFGSPRISEQHIQQALSQFVRAMVTASSRWDQGYAKVFSPAAPNRALDVSLSNLTPQENRGRHLFMTGLSKGGAGCSSCHMPPTFALAPDARSNGLDAGERRLFKAPSLRNVGLTGPYMHDGRFRTLEQVVAHYARGVQDGPALDDRLRRGGRPQRLNLLPADQAALAAFLRTLDDPVFTKDTRFSDPFRR